jgi:hypothetical protein
MRATQQRLICVEYVGCRELASFISVDFDLSRCVFFKIFSDKLRHFCIFCVHYFSYQSFKRIVNNFFSDFIKKIEDVVGCITSQLFF